MENCILRRYHTAEVVLTSHGVHQTSLCLHGPSQVSRSVNFGQLKQTVFCFFVAGPSSVQVLFQCAVFTAEHKLVQG